MASILSRPQCVNTRNAEIVHGMSSWLTNWRQHSWIFIRISLKYIPDGLINNNPAVVQKMAWRRPFALIGDRWISARIGICGFAPNSRQLLSEATVIQITGVGYNLHYNGPMCFILHWGRDKMAANFLTTISNTFSWLKIYEFRLRYHWSLLLRMLRVPLTIFQHWFR